MSQIETNPLLNPTTAQYKQNQILVSRPPLPVNMPTFKAPFIRNVEDLRTEQIDITSVAAMQKYIDTFDWTLTHTPDTSIYKYDVTLRNLLTLAPFGVNRQAFLNLKSLLMTIENTNNAFFQGSLLCYFDPAPNNYWSSVFGFTPSLQQNFQFPGRFLIEPKTRNASQILIPINIPFNLFQHLMNNEDLNQEILDYVLDYSMGTFNVVVNVPLATKSTLTRHTFRVTGLINDLTTAGNDF